jgi:3-deoxy-D-manno-octulosonic-acid transferase
LRWQRRSSNQPIAPDTQIVLGDSMGEMFAYYAACDVALIGGSLLPFGGQNLIEACAVGTPVLLGPHTFNFAAASEMAVAEGAALRISSAMELSGTLQQLFARPEALAVMRDCGKQFVVKHRGATRVALRLVQEHLGVARGL